MSDETLQHPPPSAQLRKQVELSAECIRVLPPGELLWRVHSRGGSFPYEWNEFRAYGPTSSRFDHHLLSMDGKAHLQARHISYVAPNWLTCIAEVVQGSGVLDPKTNEPWLVGFRLVREVCLLDVTGMWSNWSRASMAINNGNRALAREWSKAIYEAYPELEGIWYSSRWHPGHCSVALYERAENALPAVQSIHRALADPKFSPRLLQAVKDFRYTLTNYP